MKGRGVLAVFGRSVGAGSSPRTEDDDYAHDGRDSENPGTNHRDDWPEPAPILGAVARIWCEAVRDHGSDLSAALPSRL